jgi:fatty acid desaturase
MKCIAKRSPTQNTLEQEKPSTQKKAQADLLYILALIAMVLLILLLLKNFPLLSLLLFIIALLLVLRYFDII